MAIGQRFAPRAGSDARNINESTVSSRAEESIGKPWARLSLRVATDALQSGRSASPIPVETGPSGSALVF